MAELPVAELAGLPVAELPTVSILIPTLNEEKHLGDVLEACARQTYPGELIEVLVVDGGSTDGTRMQFDRFRGQIRSLSWLENPWMRQADGLNLAAEHSTGEVLVRWDAHAQYPDEYVEIAVRLLQDPGVDVVGGQWIPTGSTLFEDAVAAAMGSRIGVGSDRYARVDRRRIVDTVSCGVMTRATFDSVGGFDTTLWPAGEDADLMFRIRREGGTVLLDPELEVLYFPRGSPRRLAKQYYGYGLAKADMLLKHRALPSLRPLAPAALVAGLVASMVAGAVNPRYFGVTMWVATGYSGVLVVGAAGLVSGSATRRLRAAATAPLMHVPYGVGVWIGLGGAAFQRQRQTRRGARSARGGRLS